MSKKVSRVAVVCALDGETIYKQPAQVARSNSGLFFCSRACKTVYFADKFRTNEPRACEREGCERLATPPNRFCGMGCSGLAGRVAKVVLPCSGVRSDGSPCPQTIERYPSSVPKSGRGFCSTECRDSTPCKPRRGIEMECALMGDCCFASGGNGRRFYRGPNAKRQLCSRECVGRQTSRRAGTQMFSCCYVGCGVKFPVPPSIAKVNANRFCSKEHEKAQRQVDARSTRKRTSDGYITVYRPEHPNAQPSTGRVMEHIEAMTEALGRSLAPGEEVHHVNGVRDDNRVDGPPVNWRSGNLELWLVSQPAGQRVVDLVEWAREILARYDDRDRLLARRLVDQTLQGGMGHEDRVAIQGVALVLDPLVLDDPDA